jgi:hypothetical protein
MVLERTCHYLAVYMHEAITKTQVLPKLARNDLKLAIDILGAGCGIWGKDFWTPPPSGSAVISKLTAALGQNVPPKHLESPGAFRDLSHAYPVLSELDWGLPLLALVHANPLGQGNADEVLAALRSDEEDRKRVYMEALKPRLLYGGLLSKYVAEVYKVAKAFETLNEGIQFPSNCRLCFVNDKGYMTGLNNTPVYEGHTQFVPGRAPPIPFPASCTEVKPMPTEELAGLIASRRLKESDAVNGLLKTLGITLSPAVEARNTAIRVVDCALQTDSHKDNRTDFLQPTASMMEAVHTPSVMYGM